MKAKQTITAIFLGLMLVVFLSNSSAQDKTFFNSNFEPKSETKALIWSVSGTLLPIATGLGILFADKGKIKRYHGQYTDWSYRESPDRTLPIVLMISGVMVGPSFGYFYGGEAQRGMTGALLRLVVGTGSFVIGE